MRIFVGAVSLSLSFLGCASVQPRLLPELTQVDVSRPRVVSATTVAGTGCGPNALRIAIDDLLSIDGVHGFIAAVLEEDTAKGKDCVVITAHPFTYGCAPAPHSFRSPQPKLIPAGPAQCASTNTCDADCATYASKLNSGEFETSGFKNRCVTRCQQNDTAFMTCARAVSTPDSVRACEAQR